MSIQEAKTRAAMVAILEENRTNRGLSQEQLAKRASIAYGTYRNIERNDVDLKIADLVSIAAALSTTPLKGTSGAPVEVTAEELVRQAVERAGGLDQYVSEVYSTLDDLERKRLQKAAAALTPAEIEKIAIAADADKDIRNPEPETP